MHSLQKLSSGAKGVRVHERRHTDFGHTLFSDRIEALGSTFQTPP